MKELSKLFNEIMDEYKTITDTCFDLFDENDTNAQNDVIKTLREFQKKGDNDIKLEFITKNDEEYIFNPQKNDLGKTIDFLEKLLSENKVSELILNTKTNNENRYGYYLISNNNFNNLKSFFKKPKPSELPLIENDEESQSEMDVPYLEMLIKRYKESKKNETSNINEFDTDLENHDQLKSFWDTIEKIDWKNTSKEEKKTDAITKCAKIIAKELKTKENLIDFQNKVVDIRKNLSNEIVKEIDKKNNLDTISNYELWDISSHIVGCGKNDYEKVESNPSKWIDYKDCYVENFEYAICEAFDYLNNTCNK